MKHLICIFLIASTASTSIIASEESVESTDSANTPIHVTVEPAPTPNVTVQAAVPPNVTVNLPEDSIWWKALQLLVTVLGIIIAAGVIFWQMDRQHRSALLLQKENAREALHSEVYDKLRLAIVNAQTAVSNVSPYVRLIPTELLDYRERKSMGIDDVQGSPIIRKRVPEFGDLHSQLSSAVVELLIIFESYAIAIPKFEVFQNALRATLYDAMQASVAVSSELLTVLPTELGRPLSPDPQYSQEQHYVPDPPDDNKLAQLQRVIDAYLTPIDNIGFYVHDLRVEAQNTLLKDLYPGQRVPLRQPIDPADKVISVDQATELKRYFREETSWGEAKQASEKQVREKLAADDKLKAKFKETDTI